MGGGAGGGAGGEARGGRRGSSRCASKWSVSSTPKQTMPGGGGGGREKVEEEEEADVLPVCYLSLYCFLFDYLVL